MFQFAVSDWKYESIYGFHGAGCCYFGWIPKHKKSIAISNPEKQRRTIFVTCLWIVPHTWGCTLGAEYRCLLYDERIFQKCLEICEIGESRWMLKNILKIVGAFKKKHWLKIGGEMLSNVKYLCGWGSGGIA